GPSVDDALENRRLHEALSVCLMQLAPSIRTALLLCYQQGFTFDEIGEIHERAEHWLAFWQTVTDDAESAQYMVLTACRMWLFAVEKRHASKADAGRWAL